MAENSKISWTHHSFNPWLGCTKVSDGCKHCYAEALVTNRMGLPLWGPNAKRKRTSMANWRGPEKWDKEAAAAGERRRVFCASLADVFEDHPDVSAAREDLWSLIGITPHLDWLILTKRPENIERFLPEDWEYAPYENVWLGTSIESIAVERRADWLRGIPAAVRFISYEPALGPLDRLNLAGIDWVIYGGESGVGFRTDNQAWARTMRDKCKTYGVSFFYKQTAGRWPATEPTLDGEKIEEYPTPRRVDAGRQGEAGK